MVCPPPPFSCQIHLFSPLTFFHFHIREKQLLTSASFYVVLFIILHLTSCFFLCAQDILVNKLNDSKLSPSPNVSKGLQPLYLSCIGASSSETLIHNTQTPGGGEKRAEFYLISCGRKRFCPISMMACIVDQTVYF